MFKYSYKILNYLEINLKKKCLKEFFCVSTIFIFRSSKQSKQYFNYLRFHKS